MIARHNIKWFWLLLLFRTIVSNFIIDMSCDGGKINVLLVSFWDVQQINSKVSSGRELVFPDLTELHLNLYIKNDVAP